MKYVSFSASGIPLGGIGTGSVEIRADGKLYEWHIFNNGKWAWRNEDRNKEYMSPDDFFLAIRAKKGKEIIVRLLRSSLTYELGGNPYHLPWLRPVTVEFNGEPPFAFIKYVDDKLPVEVTAEVFSPFIPGDVKNSALPVAIFYFKIKNNTNERIELSLLCGVKSPFVEIPHAESKVSVKKVKNGLALVFEEVNLPSMHSMRRGSLAICSFGKDLNFSYKLEVPLVEPYFRTLGEVWVELRGKGELKSDKVKEKLIKGKCVSLLCIKTTLEAKEEVRIPILLTWFFPNLYDNLGYFMGHMYENWFSSALDVANYIIKNFDDLYSRTKFFHDLLYNTTVDYWLIDLIASQLTTLVKSTYYTKDGLFGIWEGYGCCGLNTTDVAYYGSIMILQLFPELEKQWLSYHAKWQLTPNLSPYYEAFALAIPENMSLFKEYVKKDPSIIVNLNKFKKTVQEIVKKTGKDPEGRIPHYFVGSFKRPDTYNRPDMIPEFILMAIRDAIWLGDLEFLKSLWNVILKGIDSILRVHDEPKLKLLYHYTPAGGESPRTTVMKNFEWAWSLGNVMEVLNVAIRGYTYTSISVQTFDAWSFRGIATFTSLIWLAALRAAEEAAEILNDTLNRERISSIFKEGKENFDKLLWNGEYFDLWYDPVTNIRDKGCASCQLDGQMFASLMLDLGYIIERDKVVKSLKSIFKYNFIEDEGLINGSYPGKPRPSIAGNYELPNGTGLPYEIGSQIDTPWTGIELEVAAHMIHEGLIEDALKILKAQYERYSKYGLMWNHVECGGHYYRSMASWLVLMAIEGLFYNGFEKRLRFMPKINEKAFEGILVVTGNWGKISQKLEGSVQIVTIRMKEGSITIKRLELSKLGENIKKVEVLHNGSVVSSKFSVINNKVLIELEKEVEVKEDSEFMVKITY